MERSSACAFKGDFHNVNNQVGFGRAMRARFTTHHTARGVAFLGMRIDPKKADRAEADRAEAEDAEGGRE